MWNSGNGFLSKWSDGCVVTCRTNCAMELYAYFAYDEENGPMNYSNLTKIGLTQRMNVNTVKTWHMPAANLSSLC